AVRKRGLAGAVPRGPRTGARDTLDPTQRSRAETWAGAICVAKAACAPVPGDLRARAASPPAADHRARRRGAVRLLRPVLLAAPLPRATRRSGRRGHGRRRLAATDRADADRRVLRLSHLRLHR